MPIELAPRLHDLLARPRWCVGFSGGLDSTVLLYLLRDYLLHEHVLYEHNLHERQLHEQRAQQAPAALPELVAVHINHGLSPDADAWQRHCEHLCAALAITCHSVSVAVAAEAGDGLEAAARSARYAAFAELMHADDVLLLAHHRDDQVETVVLKLFRSSGINGLAGMRERTVIDGRLRVRPLLGVGRDELQGFAAARGLRWIEDDSNRDLALSRNFVRHRVLPLLSEHWPQCRRQLLSVSRAAHDSAQLLEEVADQDLAAIADRDAWGYKLALAPLQALSQPRIKNTLTRWLHQLGVPALRQRQWPVLFEQLLTGGGERAPALALVGGSLRRYRGALYWVPEALAPVSRRAAPSCPAGSGGSGGHPDREVDCALPGACALGAGGTLHARYDDAGAGLRAGNYRVTWRGCSASWRSQRQTRAVKRALAVAGVPPWWRDSVPLLFARPASPQAAAPEPPCGTEAEQHEPAGLLLAAIGDGYVDPAFLARAGDAGVRLSWQQPSAWQPAAGRKVIEAEV